MGSYFILLLQCLACLGFGAYTLHFLSITKRLDRFERITWSFALGFGFLGWILFFVGALGLITDVILLLTLIVGASGTGLQELTTLLNRKGVGVSQVIGVGGRDLSDTIGGIMMKQGISMLSSDPKTELI